MQEKHRDSLKLRSIFLRRFCEMFILSFVSSLEYSTSIQLQHMGDVRFNWTKELMKNHISSERRARRSWTTFNSRLKVLFFSNTFHSSSYNCSCMLRAIFSEAWRLFLFIAMSWFAWFYSRTKQKKETSWTFKPEFNRCLCTFIAFY